ncbi:MAG: hypothetical protein ACI4JM_04465 [Oscillospiraceae bacterium]
MELNFTPQKIKKLIENSKVAEPYAEDDEVFSTLDGIWKGDFNASLNDKRMFATSAKRLLDAYFKEHPEDCIENYL